MGFFGPPDRGTCFSIQEAEGWKHLLWHGHRDLGFCAPSLEIPEGILVRESAGAAFFSIQHFRECTELEGLYV